MHRNAGQHGATWWDVVQYVAIRCQPVPACEHCAVQACYAPSRTHIALTHTARHIAHARAHAAPGLRQLGLNDVTCRPMRMTRSFGDTKFVPGIPAGDRPLTPALPALPQPVPTIPPGCAALGFGCNGVHCFGDADGVRNGGMARHRPATSAPGLGSAAATSAPGLGSLCTTCHIRTGTGLTRCQICRPDACGARRRFRETQQGAV